MYEEDTRIEKLEKLKESKQRNREFKIFGIEEQKQRNKNIGMTNQ